MSGCKGCGGHWCNPHALQKSTLCPLPFFSSVLARCRASAPNFSSPALTEVEGGATRHLEVHRAALQMCFLTAISEERSCSVVWLSRVKRAPLGELLKKQTKKTTNILLEYFLSSNIDLHSPKSSTLMFTHLGAARPTSAQWLCLFARVCRLIRSVVGSNASYDLLGGSMQPTCGW